METQQGLGNCPYKPKCEQARECAECNVYYELQACFIGRKNLETSIPPKELEALAEWCAGVER